MQSTVSHMLHNNKILKHAYAWKELWNTKGQKKKKKTLLSIHFEIYSGTQKKETHTGLEGHEGK